MYIESSNINEMCILLSAASWSTITTHKKHDMQ